MRSDRVNPVKFYVLWGGTLYISTNGGASFAVTNIGLPGSARKFKAIPGREGDVWGAGDGTTIYGVWRSTDSGAIFTKLANVAEAESMGFGKAASGQIYPAIYVSPKIDGVRGVYRSHDADASWIWINDDAHQYGNFGEASTGDPRVYGRVYVGINDRAEIYGDSAGSNSSSSSGSSFVSSSSSSSSSAIRSSSSSSFISTSSLSSSSSPALYNSVSSNSSSSSSLSSGSLSSSVSSSSSGVNSSASSRSSVSSSLSSTSNAGVTASVTVINSWCSGYCGNITVVNNGSQATTWAAMVTVGGAVSRLWSATWSQSASVLSLAGLFWNGILGGGQPVIGIVFYANN